MPSLPDYVARITGLSYDQAVAYASGTDTPPTDGEHTTVAQALTDGWTAAENAEKAVTVVQDPFAALAVDASIGGAA